MNDLAYQSLKQLWTIPKLSQRLFTIMGVTITIIIFVVSIIFSYFNLRYVREQLNHEMRSLISTITAASINPILLNDLNELEAILERNGSFPHVESILVVDTQARHLAEVVKKNGQVEVLYGNERTPPLITHEYLNAHSGKPVSTSIFDVIYTQHRNIEIWQPIHIQQDIAHVRLRYNLDSLTLIIRQQWTRTFIIIFIAVFISMFIIRRVIRETLLALERTTAFANHLSQNIGATLTNSTSSHEVFQLIQSLNNLSTQLHYQESALTDQMNQTQSILDNLVDAVICIDKNGAIRSFNHAAERIFGYDVSEIMGKNLRILMPEPDRTQHDAYIKNYRKTGKAQIIGKGREVTGIRKNGQVFPIELAISESISRGETIFIGIVRDITERKRLDQLKSEFVSTVSHELRTPLTSIHGSLKLIQAGAVGEVPDSAQKLIHIAQKNSERLIALINDLLNVEKLKAGKLVLKLEEVNLYKLLQNAVLENQGFASNYQVEFILQEATAFVFVHADPQRLYQVLTNLLSNAAKFSNRSKTVNVRMLLDETKVTVEIQDYGRGISKEFRDDIFKPFSQANNGNTRQHGGTGLGLHISKALIEQMHGEIGFTTEESKGSIFWITLPLLKPVSLDHLPKS
jgi:PAS domain S-box-containing protein